MIRQKYKRSRQREHILALLRSTDTHPTASWIYDQMKQEFHNLSMGTVYRNVNILVDQNLVKKIGWGSSYDRFDANTDTHYHFVCHKCSSVFDLPMDVIEGLNEQVTKNTNFKVDEHRIDFYGLCEDCRELN